MRAATEVDSVLATDEGPAVQVLNPDGAGAVILACEHASRYVPRSLGNLGLDPAALGSHIAWDPGALAVAENLSAALDAPLVASRVSRLVFDCNRPPLGRVGIAERGENQPIPGNLGLTTDAVAVRIRSVYEPFRAALDTCVRARLAARRPPLLVSIHSFTPVFLGQTRSVEIGVLHDADARLADLLLEHAAAVTGRVVRRNQPYGPGDGVTHTLKTHGMAHGLFNAMIEIRNDLLTDPAGVADLSERLAILLGRAATELTR